MSISLTGQPLAGDRDEARRGSSGMGGDLLRGNGRSKHAPGKAFCYFGGLLH